MHDSDDSSEVWTVSVRVLSGVCAVFVFMMLSIHFFNHFEWVCARVRDETRPSRHICIIFQRRAYVFGYFPTIVLGYLVFVSLICSYRFVISLTAHNSHWIPSRPIRLVVYRTYFIFGHFMRGTCLKLCPLFCLFSQ